MSILKKLLVGKVSNAYKPKFNPIQKRILNIKSIWNNDHQDDNGIEKIVRLLLSSSQLLFPGIYIKYLASKIGPEYQDLIMDIYILLKVAFPFIILINELQSSIFLIYLMTYILIETLLYIPTLIFASDLFTRPRSYKRSMLLLFFNYIEIVVSFGVLYTIGNNMNKPFEHWFDPVYFSIISSNSIGFGDYYPITTYGKMLASIQALFFLSFVILFLNFFSTKVKNKGYFDNDEVT
ncbi:potassium channel family protein [Flavobacterium aquatile]|uniref:Potassium channel protein n=1 Tax=Flavobacterium aquatile LMG 4008 = ATCC 11947 TaxID=1453498 RepID=A0A095UYS4_9FLAO|nr:potassium channel family protein [Flavobacterium aquatile]KGD67715.1 potassium channel protein [Flavobacterium aquatile LMG 4008 = ATCC 11947]OXA67578.1 potassium channel protein [Flavobacterium aquatile LMG 4008 = ATCC 11947]GEC78210.1 potassium channel protein [Flavobacterium aquatile]